MHSVGHSSIYHCIIQFEAKPSAVPSWYNFWFPDSIQVRVAPGTHLTQHPCRKLLIQCFSVWLRLWHAESLPKVLEVYYQFFLFLKKQITKVACWPPSPLTEVSNRAKFRNPELGMLFCLFMKQTLFNIVSVQHGRAGVWLIGWNWQNHFEICRFYYTTFLGSCLYPSNV